ncbi:MAG TPA: hypothetical protein EYH09_01120 [Candidatus Nanopusillus sp.]|nr:hypothetical protein [Candidatus Nanopusillus sp.]
MYLISYIRYNFPEWKRIRFSCNVSTTYDECFSVRHCNISKKEIKGVKGILAQQIKVTLEFNKNIPICHDCSITTNPKECINEPVRFKDYGFRAEVTLKANFNVEANTTFRSLVTTDTVLSEAISRKKSIYNVLNIDSTKYDVAYYTGLLDFPHVSISRLGRNYNYPIILFGENTESYDVLLFGIRELDNIKSINNLKVYIFTSEGIDLNYLNLENGKCENNYRYEFKIDDSKTLFSINCREQSSNLEGEKHYCDVKITKKFVDNYRRRDGDPLKFIIPICLRKKETFIGDYGELLVRAYINYTYEVSASSEIPYTPFYTEI